MPGAWPVAATRSPADNSDAWDAVAAIKYLSG